MFAYISGRIEQKSSNFVIIDNGGIGYKINTSVPTLNGIGAVGTSAKLFTHYHVREDDISLFGFGCVEELNMFELLITVSGVGPKVGLAILSSISLRSFALAVITNDAKALTQAQGVGLKVAQRIILELKDKIAKESKGKADLDVLVGLDDDGNATGMSIKFVEAAGALVVLGYSQYEANKAITKVYEEELEIEQLIMNALKNMNR
ncbi:MAG: Holliday junction branch migration protein RuvA [Clostridia bacterium]